MFLRFILIGMECSAIRTAVLQYYTLVVVLVRSTSSSIGREVMNDQGVARRRHAAWAFSAWESRVVSGREWSTPLYIVLLVLVLYCITLCPPRRGNNVNRGSRYRKGLLLGTRQRPSGLTTCQQAGCIIVVVSWQSSGQTSSCCVVH